MAPFEKLIFGGAYPRREKSIGLVLSLEVNVLLIALFYFVFEGNFPITSPRGAYIWKGDLTEGFLRYRFGGLIFGGACFRISRYLVRLKILEWIKLLRRHLHQIRGNWTRGNFITNSSVNSLLITRKRMQWWIWNPRLLFNFLMIIINGFNFWIIKS